ncbi:glutathione S-transferase family protein [Thalassobaculum sp. OXR-137]|uniref:glutathione S-transferase family protein n=1 Tax=Thalassobaculum sp. OXR-137 TaxID=3100173 RepID=UPI002AC8FFC4|nr:glutathione S-transferase family protein [Thalassobaculum sp. OXR-137]WPZ33759.1 glutathione S-transferase family protein [Thalassobaculum sp. OXR-137]
MAYTLFYNPDSANLVIRFALEELGVAYDDHLVAGRRTGRDAAFHKLNPTGLLPVLVDHDTGQPIAETAAILLYLSDKHGALGAPVEDAAARGEYLRRLFHLSNTVHAYLRLGFYADRVSDDRTVAVGVSDWSCRQTLEDLAIYEELLGDGRPWLLGAAVSVCDYYLAACLRWAQLYGDVAPALSRGDLERFPKLVAMLTRLQERPAALAAASKEGIAAPLFLSPVRPAG